MPSKPAVPPTPEALLSLVTHIPPKTLHAYVLAHIPHAPLDTLAALASFFAALKPPPLLHCVRCHVDYTEVDNDDRSCRVAHDEYSTNADWSSRRDCDYETRYGCCGKTVDGEGDNGPPPGLCYEGMHTINVKRARFRADWTSSDDKLDSCIDLECPNAPPRFSKKSGSTSGPTKRARPPPSEDNSDHDSDDCGSIAMEDTGVVESVRSVSELGQKNEGKGNGNSKSKGTTGMKLMKATAVRPQSRGRGQAPGETDGKVPGKKAGSAGASAPVAPVPSGSSLRRQCSSAKPRSAVSISSEEPSPPSSLESRGRNPPSVSGMGPVEIALQSLGSGRSRMRGGGAKTGGEKVMTDSEGKVQKRRKVAARAAA